MEDVIIWEESWPIPNYHKHLEKMEKLKIKQQEKIKKLFQKSREQQLRIIYGLKLKQES